MKKFTELQISKDVVASSLLFTCVIAALFISNHDDLLGYYRNFVNQSVYIGFGEYQLNKSVLKWVNDGLMAIFFFLLGLEMKYHIIQGEFQNKRSLLFPTIAAVGGFVVPASLYYLININFPEGKIGWAIPVATDTAFVLAIISFFGDRISSGAKVFIIGLSIIDDVFAVLALAIFYTPNLNLAQLYICAVPLLVLAVLNMNQVESKKLYYIAGFFLWFFTVNSGVHGTIAGIIMAFFIPTTINKEGAAQISFLKEIEQSIHSLVAFFVLPLFAFVNCELNLEQLSMKDFFSPIALGSFTGLFIGKAIGVYSFSMISIKVGWCNLPYGTNKLVFLGLSFLCGIGFTLSLFIGLQAFEPVIFENQMKLGVLLSSFLSTIVGAILIKRNL
jgi:NhaA family Na+:H+ antiporter